MLRREESETAEPQKDKLSLRRCWREPGELELAPMLETLVCDRGAAREIDLLQPARCMIGHMRHTPIRHMLAVRQCEDP